MGETWLVPETVAAAVEATKAAEAKFALESAELVTALNEACDIAVWMSGSVDFSFGGKAYDGWAKLGGARDRLHRALVVARKYGK